MTTKRTPIGRGRTPPITQRAVALFKLACEIQDDDDAFETWEAEGGRRREYLDASRDLHDLLGRPLWGVDVCDTVDCDGPPEWMVRQQPHMVADWHQARLMRIKLEEAS